MGGRGGGGARAAGGGARATGGGARAAGGGARAAGGGRVTARKVATMSSAEVGRLAGNLVNNGTKGTGYTTKTIAAIANRAERENLAASPIKNILSEIVPARVWPLNQRRYSNNPGPYTEAVYNWGKKNGFDVDRVWDTEDF